MRTFAVKPPSLPVLITLLAGATLAVFAISTAVGYAPLDLGAAARDWLAGKPSLPALVLTELRLPRAILGALGERGADDGGPPSL